VASGEDNKAISDDGKVGSIFKYGVEVIKEHEANGGKKSST
jgi:hypothetical protein